MMFVRNVCQNRALSHSLTALVLMLALLLPALSVDVRASPAHTDVGGPIISDTTWILAGSPYIVTSNV